MTNDGIILGISKEKKLDFQRRVEMSIPTKSYQELKSEIKSGDILLCSGTATFSKLIQHATGSKWSHVGFILRNDSIDRIMVLESVEDRGVRTVPLSNYVSNYEGEGNPYPGEMLIARHDAMRPEYISNLSKTAVDLLGYHYDAEEIARIAFKLFKPLFRTESSEEPINAGNTFICSEYAYECYRSVGIDIKHNGDYVTPNDFFVDPNVKPLAYLQ